MRVLLNSLYSGAKVNVGDELVGTFRSARQMLATLWKMAKEEKTILTDYQLNGNNATITLQTPTANTVKADGVTLTPISMTGETSVYKIEKSLNSAKNNVAITVTCGNETYSLLFDLGMKINMLGASALLGNVTVVRNQDSINESLDTVLVDGVEEQFVKANFVGVGVLHSLNINPTAIGYTMQSKEFKMVLYNYNEYEIELIVDFRLDGELTTVTTVKLAPGRNVLKLAENAAATFDKTLGAIILRVRSTNENESLGIGAIEIKG